MFVMMHVMDKAQSNLLALADTRALSPWPTDEAEALIHAAKMRILADQLHILTILALKASFLAMYLDAL
jgi:hypothetical protein